MNTVSKTLISSINNPDQTLEKPYPFWVLKDLLPEAVVDEICNIPWEAPDLKGVSGTREINNSSRRYFDQSSQKEFSACKAICEAFQSQEIISLLENTFQTNLENSYLRIEYAQDTDDFWLGPHTDIGVKVFTMLLYLSDDPEHTSLGTDYYADKDTHSGTVPFARNTAMVFIPSNNTWHGFEKRTIKGIRKSLVINFVTNEWRAREQLAFPENPINY